jgi:serine/threonine-protein kinase
VNRTVLRKRALVAIAVATALVVGACGQDGEEAPANASLETFVGKAGDGANVAVITDGERLSGFVTDGTSYGKWFATNAVAEDGATDLVARDGFELGSVEINGDQAVGEVQVALGQAEPFSAERVERSGGLFTAAEKDGEDSFEAGWVVLADGTELGTIDTLIDGKFVTRPAPKLEPTIDVPRFGAAAPHEHSSLFLDANIQAP